MIHFGQTCLTPSQRLPVLYVFTILPIDTDKLKASISKQSAEHNLALVYDVQYHHSLKDIGTDKLHICLPWSSKDDSIGVNEYTIQCARKWPKSIFNEAEKWIVLYVGTNDKFEALLRFALPDNNILCYQPSSGEFNPLEIKLNKILMKRYLLVEKAKDAERIGILVGTLGASRYSNVINQVRQRVKEAGKKVYTFIVGKPNVPKLANFPEVDIYVLVACPENSLLESSDFYRPIITPFELDVALNKDREWTGKLVHNFSDILPDGQEFKEFQHDDSPDFSLISGKIRNTDNALSRDAIENGTSTALATQDTRITTIHQSGGGEYLSQRSWQGLDPQYGKTPATKAVEGQSGIAWEYTRKEEPVNK